MAFTIQDELIPPRLWRAAQADWPSEDWAGWHAYADGKRASRSIESAPRSIQRCLEVLADNAPITTESVFPDLSFYGSGLHELPAMRGLKWHRDAARHPLRPWQRVQTAILYLDCGGDLVLRESNEHRVTPRPGRVVIFSSDMEHCVEPSDARRRSLAVFFYVLNSEITGSGQAEFYYVQGGQ